MIKDTESNFPPYLNSQGEELKCRDPRVEGSLDNRVSPLFVTHRVCVILVRFDKLGISPILV